MDDTDPDPEFVSLETFGGNDICVNWSDIQHIVCSIILVQFFYLLLIIKIRTVANFHSAVVFWIFFIIDWLVNM